MWIPLEAGLDAWTSKTFLVCGPVAHSLYLLSHARSLHVPAIRGDLAVLIQRVSSHIFVALNSEPVRSRTGLIAHKFTTRQYAVLLLWKEAFMAVPVASWLAIKCLKPD